MKTVLRRIRRLSAGSSFLAEGGTFEFSVFGVRAGVREVNKHLTEEIMGATSWASGTQVV